jgi:hypothetical protein
MYSGKIAVPPGGGGIRLNNKAHLIFCWNISYFCWYLNKSYAILIKYMRFGIGLKYPLVQYILLLS